MSETRELPTDGSDSGSGHKVGERNWEFYRDYLNSIEQARQENQKSYDQSILTLGSGAIAGLMAYYEANSSADYEKFIFFGVGLLLASICFTIISFPVGQMSLDKRVEFAHEYLIRGVSGARTKTHWSQTFLAILNWLSGGAFFFGGLLGVFFIFLNL